MNSIKTFICILILSPILIFAQWEKRTNGLPDDWAIGLSLDACDSNIAVISLRFEGPEGIFLTTDAGISWKEITPFKENFDEGTDISIVDENNIWVVTAGLNSARILFTSDQGETWRVQFKDSTKTTFFNYIEMFDSQNGIAMGDGVNDSQIPLFLRTSDGGQTWNSMNDSAIGGYSGDTWRRLDFVSAEIGFFNESGLNTEKRIYKTINGGQDWELTNCTRGAHCLKFYNEQLGLVRGSIIGGEAGTETKISRTTDGGESWVHIPTQFTGWGNDFEFVPGNPAHVWYTAGEGLYHSSDTGSTWIEYDLGIENVYGRDIVFIDKNHGWLLGDAGILYYTSNNGGIITAVKKIEAEEIPNEIKLYQNYPNPFNPVTTIKYSIPFVGASHELPIQLKVYDVIGNEVAVLVDEQKSAGTFEVDFDASDLSSGIYYYQLTTDDFIKTNKMILLK